MQWFSSMASEKKKKKKQKELDAEAHWGNTGVLDSI